MGGGGRGRGEAAVQCEATGVFLLNNMTFNTFVAAVTHSLWRLQRYDVGSNN